MPRLAERAQVEVLVGGVRSDLDPGFPVKFRKYGLAMVYDKHGSVSYWKSLWSNKLLRFFYDVWTLPVKEYDLVIIDFEAITSYACKLRGVHALQLSHQAAYWSKKTPRAQPKVLHWELVLRYMSPATYAIGFHFAPYDTHVLPPIIRQEVRQLSPEDHGHYTVYLPAYASEVLVHFFSSFPDQRFELFVPGATRHSKGNCRIAPPSVEDYLESFRTCRGLITGGGFEAPAEAMFLGKKLIVHPISGQYEQLANAHCAAQEGVAQIHHLGPDSVPVFQAVFASSAPTPKPFPDYANALVEHILDNAKQGRRLDELSGLEVW